MPEQKIIKGKKAVKGESMTGYGEVKERINITLTPTAIASSTAEAETQSISRSELFEKYARNPLAYLEWVRSQIQSDFEWVIFWETVEESICCRHGQKPRNLNGLAIFKFLETQDIMNGQKAVCEIRKKNNVAITVN